MKETNKQKWGREHTKQVKIRKDLHTLLKEESKKQGKSMYYLINKLIINKYEV